MAGLWRWRGPAGCTGPLASDVADVRGRALMDPPMVRPSVSGPRRRRAALRGDGSTQREKAR